MLLFYLQCECSYDVLILIMYFISYMYNITLTDLPWSGWNKYITDTQSEPADDPIFNDVNTITFNYVYIYTCHVCTCIYIQMYMLEVNIMVI